MEDEDDDDEEEEEEVVVAPLPLRTESPTPRPPPFDCPRLLKGAKGAPSPISRPDRVFLTDPGCVALFFHSSLLLPLLLILLLFSLSTMLLT